MDVCEERIASIFTFEYNLSKQARTQAGLFFSEASLNFCQRKWLSRKKKVQYPPQAETQILHKKLKSLVYLT
jgi:hypothetical protein